MREPKPSVVKLASWKAYQPVLSGPPATAGFRSGRVTLGPGESLVSRKMSPN